ncbi:MAG TPA: hypothetical protein P5232_04430 [Candidatus Moranbacteria bacterium]|nr:hypothetical protein [Candidatus Moranbacteria bacterium]
MKETPKNVYETVKEALAKKWENFKKKFEGAKSEMSKEVMDAKSPEDLIALGKKLQEQGEALRLEKDSAEREETGEEEIHKEANEENKAFDEAEAVKKAEEEAAKIKFEEEKVKKEEEDRGKAESLLAQIKSGNLGEENAPDRIVDNKERNAEPTKEISEDETIDTVALNNKMVDLKVNKPKDYEEALKNMTSREISAVAKNIAKGDWEHTLDFLNNFGNKPEIISQPEITDRFKEVLSSGNVHLYNIDRIQDLPGISKEIFNDPKVLKGIENSIRSFVANQKAGDWKYIKDSIEGVVKKANLSDQSLRNIAEELKKGGDTDIYRNFVEHFGAKRIYPELN